MEQGGGNTGTPPKSVKKSRSWFFTFNNPQNDDMTSEQMEHLLMVLEPKLYLFQLEQGEEGTPHYQGIVAVKNPIVMPKWLHKGIHWEHAKSLAASINYCQKSETRIEGPWAYNVEIKKPLKIITELRPWQAELKELLDTEPDDRTITWWWEPNGNIGKTQMAKFICVKYNALYLTGKASDAKYAVAQYLKRNQTLHAVVFDFTRSNEEYVSYEAIEAIKNGIFFSGKYEGAMCIYNSPHVICFSNFEPTREKLSEDRWSVKKLGDINEWF